MESESVDPDFSIKDEILLFDNRYVIPNDQALKLRVLKANHDSRVAGHFGQYKTLERLRQNFFWSGMEEETRDYVRSCIARYFFRSIACLIVRYTGSCVARSLSLYVGRLPFRC